MTPAAACSAGQLWTLWRNHDPEVLRLRTCPESQSTTLSTETCMLPIWPPLLEVWWKLLFVLQDVSHRR